MKDTLGSAGRNRQKRVRGLECNRIILVGARRDARKLLYRLERETDNRMTIVGFVDAGHDRTSKPRSLRRHLPVHPRTDPVPVFAGLENIEELVARTGATDVVVALSSKPRRRLHSRLSKFS